MKQAEPTYVRGDALELYEQRRGLTELAVGRAAYPDLTEQSARQKYRRRKHGKVRTEVTADEAAALAAALGVRPEFLDSERRYILVSGEDRDLVIPGGVLMTFTTRDKAVVAAADLMEDPDPDLGDYGLGIVAVEPFAVTDAEVDHHAGVAEWQEPEETNTAFVRHMVDDPCSDALRWVTDIERHLRGKDMFLPVTFWDYNYLFNGGVFRDMAYRMRARIRQVEDPEEIATLRYRLEGYLELIEAEVAILRGDDTENRDAGGD